MTASNTDNPKLQARPALVSLTQALLVLCLLGVTFVLIYSAGQLAAKPRMTVGAAVGLALMLFLGIGCIFAFWGLLKRRPYGRILSLIVLGVWLFASILQYVRTPPSGPIRPLEYRTETEKRGGQVGGLILTGSLAVLFLGMAFSKKVRAFTGGQRSDQSRDAEIPDAGSGKPGDSGPA